MCFLTVVGFAVASELHNRRSTSIGAFFFEYKFMNVIRFHACGEESSIVFRSSLPFFREMSKYKAKGLECVGWRVNLLKCTKKQQA